MKTERSSALRSVKRYTIDPVRRLYPTRQVYFRSNGKVRFISLSPRVQMAASAAVLAAMTWVGATSYFFVFRDDIVAEKNRQLAETRAAFNQLNTEMARLETDLSTTVEAVQLRQRYLEEMLAEESAATAVPAPAKDAASETDDAEPGDQARNAPPYSSGRGIGGPASVVLDTRKGVEPGGGDTPKENTDSDAPAWWQEILEWWENARIRLPEDKVDIRSARVKAMQNRVTRLKAAERRLVDAMLLRTERRIDRLRAPFETADLEIDAVLEAAAANPTGRGGPLHAISASERELLPVAGDPNFAALLRKQAKVNEFQKALVSLPVVKPLKDVPYYISSSFGGRRDPFTGGRALHGGLDMASHWKTPIHATSAGVVTFAGRNGPYGRMVEIDHGNGFKTRYGHMREILVEKGQRIAQGDRIGLMGTSGRSTGTHLHYEVRFLDEPRNPIQFFKAQDYVLQSIPIQSQGQGDDQG